MVERVRSLQQCCFDEIRDEGRVTNRAEGVEYMSGRGSIYPGGPRLASAESPAGPRGASRRPRGGEDAEERSTRRFVERRRAERGRKIVTFLVVIVALGASVGTLIGFKTRDSNVLLASPGEAEPTMSDLLAQERSRIVHELWNMETLEVSPAGGIR